MRNGSFFSKRNLMVCGILLAVMLLCAGCGKKNDSIKTYEKENEVQSSMNQNSESEQKNEADNQNKYENTSNQNQSENKKDDNSNKQSDTGITYRDVEMIVQKYLKIAEFSKSDAEKLYNIMEFKINYTAEGDYYLSDVEGRQVVNKLSESIVTKELAIKILGEFKTTNEGVVKVMSDGNDEVYDRFEIKDESKKEDNVFEVTYFGWNEKAGRESGETKKKTFTFEKNEWGDYVIKSVK